MIYATLFVSLAALFISGCSVPPQVRPDGRGGVVGIDLSLWSVSNKITDILLGDPHSPRSVHFARLDKGDDPLAGKELLESNYVIGSRAYLLNAPPGRYVAVAACADYSTSEKLVHNLFLFPDSIVTNTEAEVSAGSVAFLGEYQLKQYILPREWSPAQTHYHKRIQEGGHTLKHPIPFVSSPSSKNLTPEAISSSTHILLSRRDPKGERSFLKRSSKYFKDTDWKALVERRLKQIGAR
ncbi:hypothetical protein ACFL2T_03405 [Elusimicrobiota bacterium]